jgi:hypothetical protein
VNLDKIRHMIQEVVRQGGRPGTILLTEPDAKMLGLPAWSRQLFGIKVVVAANIPESKVVTQHYESVRLSKNGPDEGPQKLII